ncbi:MAG TPA: response regulator [Bryobacteraceae bacterium]|nr:response regulator [Bryobacteraceae bacterium]
MNSFIFAQKLACCDLELAVARRIDCASPGDLVNSASDGPEETHGPTLSTTSTGRREGRAGIILLVEDEEMLLVAVSKMLRKKGYSVIEAGDGNTAVDLLRRHNDEIAVILLDVNLPGLSSREVLEEAQRIGSGIPVILTSAFSQKGIESSFVGVRVDHFIRKPYRLATLVELLQNVLHAS